MNRYYLVMTFTVCHGKSTHAIKNGKPSISIRTISHGYVSHNQRVTVTMNNRSSWVQLGPYPTNKVTRISKNLEYIIFPQPKSIYRGLIWYMYDQMSSSTYHSHGRPLYILINRPVGSQSWSGSVEAPRLSRRQSVAQGLLGAKGRLNMFVVSRSFVLQ